MLSVWLSESFFYILWILIKTDDFSVSYLNATGFISSQRHLIGSSLLFKYLVLEVKTSPVHEPLHILAHKGHTYGLINKQTNWKGAFIIREKGLFRVCMDL